MGIVDPSRLNYPTPEFVTNANDFLAQWSVHHHEGDQPLLHLDQAQYGNMYKVSYSNCNAEMYFAFICLFLTIQAGDPVLIKYFNGLIGYFSFPSALNSLTCHDSNPVGIRMFITWSLFYTYMYMYTTIFSILGRLSSTLPKKG